MYIRISRSRRLAMFPSHHIRKVGMIICRRLLQDVNCSTMFAVKIIVFFVRRRRLNKVTVHSANVYNPVSHFNKGDCIQLDDWFATFISNADIMTFHWTMKCFNLILELFAKLLCKAASQITLIGSIVKQHWTWCHEYACLPFTWDSHSCIFFCRVLSLSKNDNQYF